MPDPAVETRALTKTFPSQPRNPIQWMRRETPRPAVEALKGVDLVIPKGELFGLLGANGAGKTTLVKILSTLLLPTSGEAYVAGHDVQKEARAIRRRVGVVLGGERALYWRLTARENLWYFSQLYDMPRAQGRDAVERVLAEVDLLDRADDRVENYSKGMKQRLHIARGLLTDPDILLLDEPTIGLDPHAARGLRALVRRLVDEDKRTVVLTTHYLYEADELSDRIGILHGGRVVALDTPETLKMRHAGTEAMLVRVRRGTDELERRLAGIGGVAHVLAKHDSVHGGTEYRLTGHGLDDAVAEAASAAGKQGLLGVDLVSPTLEDVFVALTGAAIPEPST